MRVLPRRWQRKPAGIGMQRNYVPVPLCIYIFHCTHSNHMRWLTPWLWAAVCLRMVHCQCWLTCLPAVYNCMTRRLLAKVCEQCTRRAKRNEHTNNLSTVGGRSTWKVVGWDKQLSVKTSGANHDFGGGKKVRVNRLLAHNAIFIKLKCCNGYINCT